MSTEGNPFLLRDVVDLASRNRRKHVGPNGAAWGLLTDAQKAPWLVRAYRDLGGDRLEADWRLTEIRRLARELRETPISTAYIPDQYAASTQRTIGKQLLEILDGEQA